MDSLAHPVLVLVENPSHVWMQVQQWFERRSSVRDVVLDSPSSGAATIGELPLKYALSERLSEQEVPVGRCDNPFHWCRQPFLHVIFVHGTKDEYKAHVRDAVAGAREAGAEWLLVRLGAIKHKEDDVFDKMCRHFSRERCCLLSWTQPEDGGPAVLGTTTQWLDYDQKIRTFIRSTLKTRVGRFHEELAHLDRPDAGGARAVASAPSSWSFSTFVLVKHSYAATLASVGLYQDSLMELQHLEACYLHLLHEDPAAAGSTPASFGGNVCGDDVATFLDPRQKPLPSLLDAGLAEFDFRQHLFACQAVLQLAMGQTLLLAQLAVQFVREFVHRLATHASRLPPGLPLAWTFSAYVALTEALSSHAASNARAGRLALVLGDVFALARSALLAAGQSAGLSVPNPRGVTPVSSFHQERGECAAQDASDASNASAAHTLRSQLPEVVQSSTVPNHAASLHAGPKRVGRPIPGRDASLETGIHGAGVHAEDTESIHNKHKRGTPHKGRLEAFGSVYWDEEGGAEGGVLSRIETLSVAGLDCISDYVTYRPLKKSLSSQEEFQDLYIFLTASAAGQYRQASRHRLAAYLDGEIAEILMSRGDYREAAANFKSQCDVYLAEAWPRLLADKLPSLMRCQWQCNSAYLRSTCVAMLSLGETLVSEQDRSSALQSLMPATQSPASSAADTAVPPTANQVRETLEAMDLSKVLLLRPLARGESACSKTVLMRGDTVQVEVVLLSRLPVPVLLEGATLALRVVRQRARLRNSTRKATAAMAGPDRCMQLTPGPNRCTFEVALKHQGAYSVVGVSGVLAGHLRFNSDVGIETTNTTCDIERRTISSRGLSCTMPVRSILNVDSHRARLCMQLGNVRGPVLGKWQHVAFEISHSCAEGASTSVLLDGAKLHLQPAEGLLLASDPAACVEVLYKAHPDLAGSTSSENVGLRTSASASTSQIASDRNSAQPHVSVAFQNGIAYLPILGEKARGLRLWIRMCITPLPGQSATPLETDMCTDEGGRYGGPVDAPVEGGAMGGPMEEQSTDFVRVDSTPTSLANEFDTNSDTESLSSETVEEDEELCSNVQEAIANDKGSETCAWPSSLRSSKRVDCGIDGAPDDQAEMQWGSRSIHSRRLEACLSLKPTPPLHAQEHAEQLMLSQQYALERHCVTLHARAPFGVKFRKDVRFVDATSPPAVVLQVILQSQLGSECEVVGACLVADFGGRVGEVKMKIQGYKALLPSTLAPDDEMGLLFSIPRHYLRSQCDLDEIMDMHVEYRFLAGTGNAQKAIPSCTSTSVFRCKYQLQIAQPLIVVALRFPSAKVCVGEELDLRWLVSATHVRRRCSSAANLKDSKNGTMKTSVSTSSNVNPQMVWYQVVVRREEWTLTGRLSGSVHLNQDTGDGIIELKAWPMCEGFLAVPELTLPEFDTSRVAVVHFARTINVLRTQ